ncbi:MAG: hypothetical protein GKR94_17900 [Gammaproteobacteria bacterium]|nr:hypothetical protein [Gammaproteobacteria bacterium]
MGLGACNALNLRYVMALAGVACSGVLGAGSPISFEGEELEYSPGYRAIDIASNHAYEACVELQSGQALRIGFEANAQLEFEVHFHRGGEVEFPVTPHRTRGAAATFSFDASRNYCLMWTNKGKRPVLLEFGYDFNQK